MEKKKGEFARPSAKVGRPAKYIDPDDAPEFTDAMLARAEIKDGDKVIRRGRPSLGTAAKVPVMLRLDPDVVTAYRATGTGWQSRINADLKARVARGAKLGGSKL